MKAGRWQLLGAAGVLVIVIFHSFALQLRWGNCQLTAEVDASNSTAKDRLESNYAFGADPRGKPQLKSGPSQEEVEAILLKVEPEFQEQCRNILEGRPKSFAQIYQDWFLYHNFFSHVPYGEGFYVDIGANDAFAHSNTLFFDKCLGWRGLCWEPNPEKAAPFANRSCTLIPHCVHTKDHIDVGFDVDGTAHQNAHVVPLGTNGSDITVRCRRLDAVLREQGVSRIDFVSLDVEGAELLAVRCFPFDEWNVRVWIVETNKQDKFIDFVFLRAQYSKVADLLYRNHFFRHAGEIVDSVYVRNAEMIRYPLLDGPRTFKKWTDLDKECSDEDRKWNNCDSTSGMPLLEMNEINGSTGEPQDWCQSSK